MSLHSGVHITGWILAPDILVADIGRGEGYIWNFITSNLFHQPELL